MTLSVRPLVALLLLGCAAGFAQEGNQPEPVAFGMMSNNSGCVIFAEGKKTSHRFYGLAATSKTTGQLTTIETVDYTFDQKVVPETQDDLNRLMQLAQKDHVKFVKIPEKYSPDLLEKARAMCK